MDRQQGRRREPHEQRRGLALVKGALRKMGCGLKSSQSGDISRSRGDSDGM